MKGKGVNGIAFSCDKVWIGCHDTIVRVYDVRERTLLREIKFHSQPLTCIIGTTRQIWSSCPDKILIIDADVRVVCFFHFFFVLQIWLTWVFVNSLYTFLFMFSK